MLYSIPIHAGGIRADILDDGRISFTVLRNPKRMIRFFLGVLGVSGEKNITLDEIGTFVWQHCDGQRTVADISQCMKDEYKLTRKEAQVSVLQFIQLLMKKGILTVKMKQKKEETDK